MLSIPLGIVHTKITILSLITHSCPFKPFQTFHLWSTLHFNNVLAIFLGLECVRKLSDFIKNILCCEDDEGLACSEQHEGE